MDKNFLFKIRITNARSKEILEYILKGLKKGGEKYYVVTPNPEILVYATKHPDFKDILNNARLALCDGVGMIWAGKLLGKNFKEKTTGVDLMENLCREISKQPITVGFLGGRSKIAEKVAECLCEKYPGLKVVFAAPEWEDGWLRSPTSCSKSRSASAFNDLNLTPSSLNERLLSRDSEKSGLKSESAFSSFTDERVPRQKISANRSSNQCKSIDILFVAFGFPKQEEWMAEHIDKLPVKVMMGVGGAFDYISGEVSRAPLLIRLIGFEWLYRLICQPWRWKRQLSLIEFIYLVLKEKIVSGR